MPHADPPPPPPGYVDHGFNPDLPPPPPPPWLPYHTSQGIIADENRVTVTGEATQLPAACLVRQLREAHHLQAHRAAKASGLRSGVPPPLVDLVCAGPSPLLAARDELTLSASSIQAPWASLCAPRQVWSYFRASRLRWPRLWASPRTCRSVVFRLRGEHTSADSSVAPLAASQDVRARHHRSRSARHSFARVRARPLRRWRSAHCESYRAAFCARRASRASPRERQPGCCGEPFRALCGPLDVRLVLDSLGVRLAAVAHARPAFAQHSVRPPQPRASSSPRSRPRRRSIQHLPGICRSAFGLERRRDAHLERMGPLVRRPGSCRPFRGASPDVGRQGQSPSRRGCGS